MEFKTATQIFVGVIIIVGILMAVLGFNGDQIDKAIQWFIPIGLGLITSSIAGALVEAYGGDSLKNISVNVEVWHLQISISAFFITTLIIKFWLF